MSGNVQFTPTYEACLQARKELQLALVNAEAGNLANIEGLFQKQAQLNDLRAQAKSEKELKNAVRIRNALDRSIDALDTRVNKLRRAHLPNMTKEKAAELESLEEAKRIPKINDIEDWDLEIVPITVRSVLEEIHGQEVDRANFIATLQDPEFYSRVAAKIGLPKTNHPYQDVVKFYEDRNERDLKRLDPNGNLIPRHEHPFLQDAEIADFYEDKVKEAIANNDKNFFVQELPFLNRNRIPEFISSAREQGSVDIVELLENHLKRA